MKNMFKVLCVAALGTLPIGAASLLHAQAASNPRIDERIDRIVVTGSQIPRADKETPSPVQIITAAEIRASGYTSVSEVLRDITANGMATLNQGFNRAFSGGASGVSLRGLTLGLTLVLIDGRRMAPYPLSEDGQRPFVDITSIPFDAVERIEILKDGASAVYGSDTIAGVINVILKKRHQGTLLSAETGTTQHGGGNTSRVSVTHGFGSVTSGSDGFISIEYRKQDKIMVNQRSGDWTRMDWRAFGGEDLRPGARNAALISPRLNSAYLQIPGSSTDTASSFAFYPGCTFAAMRASQCLFADTWSTLQPPSENLNVLASYNAKFAGDWELNLKGSVFNSKNQQIFSPQAIPEGSFAGYTRTGLSVVPAVVGAIANYTVPGNYPGNTLGVPASVIATIAPGDGAIVDLDTQSTRFVAELSGSFAEWEIKSAVGVTRVETKTDVSNVVNPANLYAALNSTDPNTRYLLGGGNSAAVMNFVAPRANNTQTNKLNFFELHGTRDLMKLHGGPLRLGLGMSYIAKELNAPNPKESQNGSMLLNGAYAFGKEKDTAFFAEIVAPVLKSLELAAAVRRDHCDIFGNSTTPKAGFKFSPMSALSLRGTASKGFRAPAPAENGTGGFLFGFTNLRDPLLCPVSNADGTPNLAAATNVPAYCNFAPLYLQGTNKSPQPEKSKSYTLGVILEPIKGWSTTLDYYKTEVNNQIISGQQGEGQKKVPFCCYRPP